VETVLQAAPGIKQAAVAVAAGSEEDKRLTGFILTEESYEKEKVLAYLYNTLPAYMIPGQLIQVAEIPLTASGKVNRKELARLEGAYTAGKVSTPPRNELEAALVDIWKGLLKTDPIGIYDNFFELGGHSLMAFRLVLAIEKKWKVTIPLKAIFQLPDIQSLAASVSVLLHLNRDVVIIDDEEEIKL
jgi:acyl carrier protein